MTLRLIAVVSLALVAAMPGSPVPSLPALAQSQNPCVAALAVDRATAMRAAPDAAQKYGRFGADSRDIRDLLQFSAVASKAREIGRAHV